MYVCCVQNVNILYYTYYCTTTTQNIKKKNQFLAFNLDQIRIEPIVLQFT